MDDLDNDLIGSASKGNNTLRRRLSALFRIISTAVQQLRRAYKYTMVLTHNCVARTTCRLDHRLPESARAASQIRLGLAHLRHVHVAVVTCHYSAVRSACGFINVHHCPARPCMARNRCINRLIQVGLCMNIPC